MRLPFLFLATTLCGTAFAADPREVYYQGFLAPENITPTFDKGYLLVYDFDKIDAYAPDGRPLYSVSAEVPNAKIANIQNAAADVDGTMAGAVEYSRDSTTRHLAEGSYCSTAPESKHDSSTPAGIGRHKSASVRITRSGLWAGRVSKLAARVMNTSSCGTIPRMERSLGHFYPDPHLSPSRTR
jgi:hypothetical protein